MSKIISRFLSVIFSHHFRPVDANPADGSTPLAPPAAARSLRTGSGDSLLALIVFALVGCQGPTSYRQDFASASSLASSAPSDPSRTTVIQAQVSTDTVKLEFFVNGQLVCTVTQAPFNCPWDVPQGSGIAYTLKTIAHNSSGQTGESQVVTVTSR